MIEKQKKLIETIEKSSACNSDLKQVIKKLDSELKKEKTQSSILKQHLTENNSILDGFQGILDNKSGCDLLEQ